jgi:hypothetical protein
VTVIVRDVTLHEVVCDLPRCPAHLSSVESAQHLTQRMAERRWVTVGLRHFCTDGHRLRFLQVAR